MIKMSVEGGEEIAQVSATGEQESIAWSTCTGCGGCGEGLSAMPSLNVTDIRENGGEELQSQDKDEVRNNLQSQAKYEVRDNLNPEDVPANLETANLDYLVIKEPGKQIAPALNCGVEEVLGESLSCHDGDGEGLSDMPFRIRADAEEIGGEDLQTEAKDEIRYDFHPGDVSAKLETANLKYLVITERKLCKEQDLACDSELKSNELVETKDIKNSPQMACPVEELDTPHDLTSLCGKQITPVKDRGFEGVLGENLFYVDGDLGCGEGLSDMLSHNGVDVEENGEELQSEAKDEIRDNRNPDDVFAKLETANLDSLVNTEQKLHKEQDSPSFSQLKLNDGNRITQMQGECDADNNEIANREEGHNCVVGSSSSLFGTLPCQALEDWSRNYTDEFSKWGESFEAGHLPESGGCQSDDVQAKSNLETHNHNSGIQDTDITIPHSTRALDSVGIVFSWGSLIGHGEFVLDQNAACQDEDEVGHDTEASTQGDEIGNSRAKILLEGGSGQADESFDGGKNKEIKVDFPTAFTAEDLSAHFTKLELQTDKKELQDDKQKGRLATRDNNKLCEVFTPLSSEAEIAVNKALSQSRRDEVLVFHRRSNIEVTRAVIQCLRPGSWLNDEVINVYMELLKERELREPKKVLKCHFFNTFFYNKLFKNSRTYDYQAVQRWTTHKKLGYSLLDCDKILIPIHHDVHWCLAVIDVRMKQLQYLDSLQGRDKNVLPALARYIADESKDKAGEELDVSTWEHIYTKNIPKQHNGCDCGMFMLKYADLHSRGAPLGFTQAHMNYFRRRTVWEILQLSAT